MVEDVFNFTLDKNNNYIVFTEKYTPLLVHNCSHGAGRKMSRTKASEKLTKKVCNEAMEGIVFDGWNKVNRGRLKGSADLSESPLAYKDIDEVMESQKDLVEIKVKLTPIANMKG